MPEALYVKKKKKGIEDIVIKEESVCIHVCTR